MSDTIAEQFQLELLNTIRHIQKASLSPEIELAYISTPRHLFVKRFYQHGGKNWNLVEVNKSNLELKLATLYQDNFLPLVIDQNNTRLSSISQPSFVLYMLEFLQIEKGHKILEIGAATGWNAALMGKLVGSQGEVYSIEIIPQLVEDAVEIINDLKLNNVHVLLGDGAFGDPQHAPYDRIVFTVGAYDLPLPLYDQIKPEGLLLLVLKNKGFSDNLFLMKKKKDYFEAIDSTPCSFVNLRGQYEMEDMGPADLASIPFWPHIKDTIVAQSNFWCGGRSLNNQEFLWKASGLMSFLAITEPTYNTFLAGSSTNVFRQSLKFGLVDAASQSVALVNDDDRLIAYGNTGAMEKLIVRTQQWQKLGMPGASCFSLKVFPVTAKIDEQPNQWIINRTDSQFIWTLEDN